MTTNTWFTFFALLTVGANVAVVTIAAMRVASLTGGRARERWDALRALTNVESADEPVQQIKQKRRSGGKSR